MMIKNRIDFDKLPRIAFFISIAWVLLQIVFIILFWDVEQGNDQLGYIRHALDSYANNTTYPSMLNINDQYLQSPGMVNYLILQHAITGTETFSIDKFLNVLLNIGILANIFYLTRYFFNQITAYLSVIIFCLLPTNVFAPIWILSELPYLFLALTGFSLSLNKKWFPIVGASILFAIAHTFRPLILAFIVTIVVLYVIERRRAWSYICLLLPYILLLYGIGTYNKSRTGQFVTSSTTGGYNLIMTANDEAKLYADFSIFYDPTNLAYIPNPYQETFAKKDSIYKARAVEWIKNNPDKYAKLYVIKLFRLWSGDTWSYPVFGNWDDYLYILKQPESERGRLTCIRRAIQFIEGLPYYLLVLLFLFSLYKQRGDIISSKGLFLLLIGLGTAGTCLFIAEVRFHYPYLFCMVLWSAYGIYNMMQPKIGNYKT